MQFIQKIIFLYKSNSNLKIFYKFLTTKLKNIYFKKQIKEQKKGHVEFLKKKFLLMIIFQVMHLILKKF